MLVTELMRNITVQGQDDTSDCHATFGAGNLTIAYTTAMANAQLHNSTFGPCGGWQPILPKQCQGSFSVPAPGLKTSM